MMTIRQNLYGKQCKPYRGMADWLFLLLSFSVFATSAWTQPTVTDVSHDWVLDKVLVTGLVGIDNIVLNRQGELYATQELRWIGKLVKIDRQGRVSNLMSGLNRPDGLLLYRNKLYLTEEVPNGRILEYDLNSGKVTTLFTAHKPEGIDSLKSGALVISEDKVGGALIQWSRSTGKRVLIKALDRPEGLCVDSQQSIFIAETASGRILRYKNGKVYPVLLNLNNPDQIECDADGSLWIAEDANPGRVLRFINGQLEVIAKKLSYPQGIAIGVNGDVFIAEQGKSRIIHLIKKSH